ncbi:hypothetical protein AVEN_113816-1 [Araneus ventricosus]|uniref:Uncharacterized protein n=1 Tax=Araneus ventricosus TaxID=182803 RepID=A0A4Y2LZK0_ARAVE|nr:hypothetical protein AVEN_113816-1 [Araneus ventricosus]
MRKKTKLRRPGVEPGSTAWKAAMLTVIPPTLQKMVTYDASTNKNLGQASSCTALTSDVQEKFGSANGMQGKQVFSSLFGELYFCSIRFLFLIPCPAKLM